MRLLWRNLFRKPLRTSLTILGVAVALFLFCFLEAVLLAFQAGVNMAGAARLVVGHREGLGFLLPLSHRQAILQTDGVTRVTTMTFFGGPYEEPAADGTPRKEFFAQFAVDFEDELPIYPEIQIPPEQLQDLLADRAGCALGRNLAERLGKKLGDRIVLPGAIWAKSDGRPWEFTVRAIYTSDSPTFDQQSMMFHAKYLEEGRAVGKGTTGIFMASLADPKRFQEVASSIDAHFANSPSPTRSMTEKAFNMQFVQMMGNVELLFRSIGSVVVLTMLLISGNTMMMNARERTREMGVLKALGYSDARVAGLLVGESLVLAALGALLGGGGGWLLINVLHYNPNPEYFPVFAVAPETLVQTAGLAALTGVVSGLAPAVAGWRLRAAEVMRAV